MGIKHLLLGTFLLYCLCYSLAGEIETAVLPPFDRTSPLLDSGETILSHKLHAGTLQIDCQFCHKKKRPDGSISLISSCNTCHILPQDSFSSENTAEVLKHISERIRQEEEVDEYEKSELFEHEVHKWLKCNSCHEEGAPTNANHVLLSTCERCHYGTGKAFPYWRRPKQVDTLCKIILRRKRLRKR